MSSLEIKSCDRAIQSLQTQSLQYRPAEVLEHHDLQEITFLCVCAVLKKLFIHIIFMGYFTCMCILLVQEHTHTYIHT